ncbi:hypothetical protein B0H11DRAFT_642496 [Mycena galericulata]|nr:hypothetical protein B0H11DRAFT_642496 [Mycena galericulata]
MPRHMATKLWKRNCGLSQWFSREDIAGLDVFEPTSNAPIKTLPVELLGEIFSWTLGDWGEMTVSVSIPMLWATIWIDRPRAAHLSMVELWIERSRNLPLSINLRQTDPKSCLSLPTSLEHDLTNDIFALLVPHLYRWHTVDFTFKTDAQQSLLSLPGDVAVALEHVALNTNSWDTTSAESLQSVLYSRPSLRSIHFVPGSKQPDVPWKQLTHLEADPECTLDTCLSILASCPALSSVTFTASAVPDWAHTPFHHPEQHLTLPALVDLFITASRIDLSPFLNRITLPALRALTLDYRHVPRTMPDSQSLHTLLARSACTLDAFSLHETARVRDDTRHIAYLHSPHMASLKALDLHVDMTDEIVEFLTSDAADSDSDSLPNLTYLALRDRRGAHISDDALARMLSSRIAPTDLAESFCSSRASLRVADLQLRLAGHTHPVLSPEKRRDCLDLHVELLSCFCE